MGRLITIFLVFLVSLLNVFPAPTYHLWMLSIVTTEYAWGFICITILLLLSGIWFHEYAWPINVIGISALMLFSLPIFQAATIGRDLEQQLTRSLGGGSVAEHGAFSLSSIFRANKTGQSESIEYKITGDHAPLAMDYYRSPLAGPRPTVVVIHGGSWSSGDSKQLPELNAYLAGLGYNVAAINYRLSPAFQNPAPVEDVRDAIDFLKDHADSLNVDSSNFVLLGRSAGAQIALLAAYTLHDKSIKGVIDFYGPADMVWGYSIPSNPWVMDSRKVMENYLGGSYTSNPKNYRASSPILFVDSNSPPTLIIHGKLDVLVAYEHSKRLDKKLSAAGVKHYFLSLPWGVHGFDYNLNGPGGQLSTYAVGRFLKSVVH